MNDINCNLNIAQSYRYVSVDIYDTLVFRLVESPNEIFRIVEEILDRENEGGSNFYKKRILAEKRARHKTNKEDICIEEIYSNLDASVKEKKRFRQIEEQLEYDLCIANTELVNMINELKNSNHIIAITTDMYLSRDFLMKILDKVGVEYDYLFISGEEGVTKKTGNLFKHVIDKMSIENTEIIHIGNDIIKDIKNARMLGINTIHIDDTISKSARYLFLHNSKSYEEAIANYYIYHSSDKIDSTEQVIGYSCLGPFLVAFCHWIHEQANNKTVWFVAREGFLIQKIYAILYPEELDFIQYVRLNKNILREPHVYTNRSLKDFFSTLPEIKEISLEMVGKYLHADDFIMEKMKKKYGDKVKKSYYVQDVIFDDGFICIFNELVDLLKEQLEEQTQLLKEYLIINNQNNRDVLLVNNSIHGNGQFILNNIIKHLNISWHITGIQFVSSNRCVKKNMDVRSWLKEIGFSNEKIHSFDRNSLLFEHFLFENIGTAIRFSRSNNEISVISKVRQKELLNDSLIEDIQKAALHFARNFKNYHMKEYIDTSFFVNPFLNLLEHPMIKDVYELNKLVDDDDIGGTKKIICSDLTMDCHRNFSISTLRDSGWRQGYMISCGMNKYLIKIFSKILFYKAVYDGYYSIK